MDLNQTSIITVLDKDNKFICYTRRKDGIFGICLTDAADVWSTDYTEETLIQFRHMFALKSTEEFILKLRLACISGDVSVVMHNTSVELRVGSSPSDLCVTLAKLEAPQATAEMKELLFQMADSLNKPDSASPSPSPSPVKNHQTRPTEFEPWQQQNCAPSVAAKKRHSGASLINPGTKKKVQATGVAFDDADDD